MRRESTIRKIKETVTRICPLAKVFLYGSQARDEAREDSDIDILILVDKEKVTYPEKLDISFPLYDLKLEEGVTISPIIFSRKEWENRPIKSPFYMDVITDGIEL